MAAVHMVTHKMVWLNQEIRNIFYYEEITGAPSDSEWQDIVDEIRADYVAELIAQLSPEWSFYGIDRRIVSTAGLLSFSEVPTAGSVVGTSGGDSVATQVAMLASVKGTSTKPNRARTYVAGLTESSMTDSLWGSTARGAVEALIDLQSVLNNAGTNALQRVSAQWNSSHTQVIVYNNIAARPALASEVPATQRRRRIGVGI